jgi:hypothetical protein
MRVGDRSRCLRCGGKIVLISHPTIISLDLGMWVHESALRRNFGSHPAEGPTS